MNNSQDEQYFEHQADIGIIGRGDSLTEAFISAAKAVFAIMTDLSSIKPKQSIQFEFEESDPELAFVIWLNQLLNLSRSKEMVCSQFSLAHHDNHWKGQAWGEPWQASFSKGTEVKGATLTMLSVKQINHHWEARCVVDV